MNIKHLTSQFSQDQHTSRWWQMANSFAPGHFTCIYIWKIANSTVEVLRLHLAVLWQQKNISTCGPSALNICYPREIWSNKLGGLLYKHSPRQHVHWLFVLNQVQLVHIYNSWMSWIRIIPSDGPGREHSLLDFRRGTTRGSLATT